MAHPESVSHRDLYGAIGALQAQVTSCLVEIAFLRTAVASLEISRAKIFGIAAGISGVTSLITIAADKLLPP